MALNILNGALVFDATITTDDFQAGVERINNGLASISTAAVESARQQASQIKTVIEAYNSAGNSGLKVAETVQQGLDKLRSSASADPVFEIKRGYDDLGSVVKNFYDVAIGSQNKLTELQRAQQYEFLTDERARGVALNEEQKQWIAYEEARISKLHEEMEARIDARRAAEPTPVKTTAAPTTGVAGIDVGTLSGASELFSSLDATTQAYLETLHGLETEQRQLKAAQDQLNESYDKGKTSETQYAQTGQALKARLLEIAEAIKTANKEQEKYAAQTGSGSINEKVAQLSALKQKWNELTEAERQDVNIINDFRAQAKALSTDLAGLSFKNLTADGEKAVSMMTQIRQLENEIAHGDINDPGMQEKIQQVGKLRQEWENVRRAVALASSNTAGLDAMKDGIRGLVGGFTALQGVMGIFNSDNQAAAETTRIVTSAMAIATGVEQLFSVAAKNSALNVYLRSLWTKEATVAQGILNTAEKENIVITDEQNVGKEAQLALTEGQQLATEGATTAQWSLNAALEANPIGVILIAITALVALLEVFGSNTDAARDAQMRLNDEIKRGVDLLEKEAEFLNDPQAQHIKQLNNELDLLKSKHASQDQILQKELEIKKAEQDRANFTKGFLGNELDGLEKNKKALIEQQEQLKKLQDELDNSKNTSGLSKFLQGATIGEKGSNDSQNAPRLQSDIQKDIDASSKAIETLQALVNAGQKAKDATDTADLEEQKKANELTQKLREDDLKNAVAHDEAMLAQVQKNSKEEFEITKKLIEDKRKLALNDPNLPDTPAAIAKINDEARKAQLDNDRKWDIQQLENRKSVVNKELALVQQGTAKELALKIQALRLEELIQEKADGVTPEKQQELRAQELKAENDLRLKYTEDEAHAELEAVIANINTRLAFVKKGSDEELQLKQYILDREADQQIISAAFEIKNEELKAAKIRAIYAKLFVDKKALDDQFADQQIARTIKRIDNAATQRDAQLDLTINNQQASDNARFKAQREKLLGQMDDLEAKHAALIAQIQTGKGDVAKLQDQAEQAEAAIKKVNAAIVALDQDHINKTVQKVAAGFAAVSSAISAIGQNIEALDPKLAKSLNQISGITKITGDFLDAGAKGGKDISADVKVITDFVSFVVDTVKSVKEAKKTIDDFNTSLLVSQVNAVENARKVAREQAAAAAITLKGLQDEAKLLQQQKLDNATQFNDLLTQIGQQQFVASEHTKRTGFFLLGKEVVQDMASLQGKTFEEIEKLADAGQLTAKAQALFEQMKKLKDEGVDLNAELAQAQEQLAQTFTATTAQNISDAIRDGFKQGKRSIADFADDFQTMITNAIFSSFEAQAIAPAIQEFYAQFSTLSQSGGQLTADEVKQLKKLYDADITKFNQQLSDIQKVAGIDLSAGGSSSNANNLITGVKQIQEQTAELIAGQLGGIRISILQLFDIAKQSLGYVIKIESNTYRTAQAVEVLVAKFTDYESGAKKLTIR